MKNSLRVLILFVCCLSAGCITRTNQISEKSEIVENPAQTSTETERSSYHIEPSAEFVDVALRVGGDYVEECVDNEITIYERNEVTTRSLPPHFWKKAGYNALFVGAGTLITAFIIMNPDAFASEGDSDGGGAVHLLYGAGTAGAGLVGLSTNVFTLIKARDDIRPLEPTEDVTAGDSYECERRDATGTEFVVGNNTHDVAVTTPTDGRWADIEFPETSLMDLAYQIPFAQLTCELCDEDLDIRLTPEASAEVILARSDRSELEFWLSENSDHHRSGEVQDHLNEVLEEERKVAQTVAHEAWNAYEDGLIDEARSMLDRCYSLDKDNESCAELHDQISHHRADLSLESARNHLRGDAYEDARRDLRKCLRLVDQYSACEDLMTDINNQEADKIFETAHELVDEEDYYGARDTLTRCIEIAPSHDDCADMHERAAFAIERLMRPTRVRDLEVLQDASGYEIYFSVSNEHLDFVKPQGTIRYYLQPAHQPRYLLLEEEVRRSDFQEVTIGIQRREATVRQIWISFDDFYEATYLVDRQHARSQTSTAMEVVIEFTDPDGHTIEGRTDFRP